MCGLPTSGPHALRSQSSSKLMPVTVTHTKIEGLPDILWNVMHGDANSGGKQIKFIDASFDQRN